ncbi:CBS domain-containing protein [Candidatus Woesearchaeota archaeon]|nr:CBS domain-containing protein [Candidatus Woesearchaeota archaeon]
MKTKIHDFIRAEDIMSKDTFVVDIKASIRDAAQLMVKYNTNCLIVMKKTKPIGIITDENITKIVAEDKNIKKTKIKSVMSKPLFTATSDNSFFEIIKLMKKKNIRKLPVLREDSLIGIITEKEVTKGVLYVNKVLNKTFRNGFISPDEYKKQEENLIKSILEKGLKKEPPWVKKEIDLLRKIYEEQEQVYKKLVSTSRKYTLTDWRKNIWVDCKFKHEKMENDEIVFMCKKLKDYCVYKDCPLNKL